jgi:amino acid transporter
MLIFQQINLVTAGGVIDYVVMCVTYLTFYYATKAQGFDRSSLPYTGYFQPVSFLSSLPLVNKN